MNLNVRIAGSVSALGRSAVKIGSCQPDVVIGTFDVIATESTPGVAAILSAIA